MLIFVVVVVVWWAIRSVKQFSKLERPRRAGVLRHPRLGKFAGAFRLRLARPHDNAPPQYPGGGAANGTTGPPAQRSAIAPISGNLTTRPLKAATIPQIHRAR